jgi:TldD protein
VTIEYWTMVHFARDLEGLLFEDSPITMVRTNVIAEKEGRRASGIGRISHRLGAEQLDDDTLVSAAREAAQMAVTMCDATAAPAGEMPVILAAGGGVLFHEAVGHGLEGDYARRGSSFYSGRIGEIVASERVSVIDWGGMPALRGSYNIDDEGTVPIKNVVIEKGLLRGFLTDRITASVMNTVRTGNARRQSYRFPPRMATPTWEGTDYSRNDQGYEDRDLCKDARRGRGRYDFGQLHVRRDRGISNRG